MAEITQKDIDDTLRAAGVSAGAPGPDSSTPQAGGISDDDIGETMRQLGIKLGKGERVTRPEEPKETVSTKERKSIERIKRTLTPLSSVTEGMPIIGAFPRSIASAVEAAIPGRGEEGETYGSRVMANEKVLRTAQQEYDKENPAWSVPANVAGGALSVAPFASTWPGRVALGMSGPSLGARLYGGTAGGATIGGLDALIRGENPLTGAMIGGGTGAVGPLVGEGARGLTRVASENIWPRPGPLKGIDPLNIKRLTGAISGETPASLTAARDRMGPTGFLSDLNPEMTDLARGLSFGEGSPKAMVREPYRVRQSEQAQDMKATLDATMGPRIDAETWKNATTEARKQAADPLYSQWRSMEVHPTPKLEALMPRLQKAGAFKMAEELSGISGEPINAAMFTPGYSPTSGADPKSVPTTATWDYVKRGLDRRIDQAYTGGDKTLARELIKLKGEMLTELEATPAGKVWKQARSEFANHSELLDQHAAGRDILLGSRSGQSVGELREELKTLSPLELKVRIQGARDAVDEAMGETIIGDTTTRNKMLAPNNQSKIKLMIGDGPGGKLIKRMEQLKYLGDQNKTVAGGSQTGTNIAAREALQPPPAQPWDVNIAQPTAMIPKGMRPGSVWEAIRRQRYGNADNQLASILTTPGDGRLDMLLKAISDEAKRRGRAEVGGERAGGALSGIISMEGANSLRRRVSQ